MSKSYPETLSIGEVADLLCITTRKVRQMCLSGEFEAMERVPGTSRWYIKSEQFTHLEVWQSYLDKVEQRRENSLKILDSLKAIYEEK